MVRITSHAHGAAVFDADEHAAADRAVSASSGNPLVGGLLGGHVTEAGVGNVGVLVGKDVEAQRALPVHAATSFRDATVTEPCSKNPAAMFRGTTLTKNKYRPTNSPARATVRAGMCRPASGSATPPATRNP